MKKIAFTGGGTAGHVMPNIALIDELKVEFECVYIGSDGQEKKLCLDRGIPFFELPCVKLRRDAFFKNFAVPFRLASSIKRAKALLGEIKPDALFSKGGYVALPASLAAPKLGIPLIVHESDFSPGLATKLTRKKAARTLAAFQPCAKKIDGEYVGAPLRKSLYGGSKVKKSVPRLLIVGGSSGAGAINDVAVKAAPELLKEFEIVHITGKNKAVAFSALGYRTLEFASDIASLYAQTDVAVSRAGANSLAELIALGIPTVAVPLEKASRGDQVQNAEYYEKLGAITVLRESDMTPDSLVRAVRAAYAEREKLIGAMKTVKVDGTDRICRIIREVVYSREPATSKV